jgi:hypothetical protein
MFGIRISSKILLLFLAVMVFALPACSAATPVPVVPTQAPVQPTAAATVPPAPTATLVPPTATSEPTATATVAPTETPVPPTATSTPVPGDQQVSGWCIPKEKAMTIKAADDPAQAPEGAWVGTFTKDTLLLKKPALSCTLVFNLGHALPAGSVVEVLDGYNHPWLKADILPSSNPDIGYAKLTHSYITEPPTWDSYYGLQVKSGDQVAWSGKLQVENSWLPAKCWDNTYPFFKTQRCRLQQDLHPWDPGYYLPTRTPVK